MVAIFDLRIVNQDLYLYITLINLVLSKLPGGILERVAHIQDFLKLAFLGI